MTIDMNLRVHRDVGDFVCGMAIRRADGLLLSGTNTLLDNVTVSGLAGRRDGLGAVHDRTRCHCSPAGTSSRCPCTTWTGSDVYDWIDPAASFHINDLGDGHVGMLEMRRAVAGGA